jgi:hypothetical protein
MDLCYRSLYVSQDIRAKGLKTVAKFLFESVGCVIWRTAG